MNKPSALLKLLEELKDSVPDSSVQTTEVSGALIYLPGENTPLRLDRAEAELLFHSEQTVEQLYEALGSPEDVAIELHDLEVTDETLECLERLFTGVDAY